MNFRPRIFLAVCIALSSFATAQAATFPFGISVGGDSTAFPNSSYGILVADVSGGSFESILSNTALLQGATQRSVGDFLGSDVLIFSINLAVANPGSNGNLFNLGRTEINTTAISPLWDAGDKLALIWFQQGTSATGNQFGFYRSDSVSDGDIAFVTPNSSLLDQFIIHTSVAQGGTIPVSEFTANNGTIAVPEPGTIFLLAFAPLLVKLLRSLRARRA